MFKLESERINKGSDNKLEFNTFINDSIKEIEICSDKNRFTQVASILINNAIKFTNEGQIEFGVNENNKKELVFYVKDTGIGISKQNQEIIFNRFRKIEEDSNNLYRGAGLGLSIAKQLITILNGNIWVESEIKKGSTFYFTINNRN